MTNSGSHTDEAEANSPPQTSTDGGNPEAAGPTLLPNRWFVRGIFTNYRRLLHFVRPYWKQLVVAGVILAINSLVALAMPLAVRFIVDAALVQQSLVLLNRVTMLLVLLFVVQAILGFIQSNLMGWTGERVIADLREELYAHLQAMPLRFFNSKRTGELLSRLSNDIATIQEAVTVTLLSLISQTIMFVGGIVIIFVMAPRLTSLMLAVVPIAVLGMILLGRLVRGISRQVQDALAEMTATAEEAIGGDAHRQIVRARTVRDSALQRRRRTTFRVGRQARPYSFHPRAAHRSGRLLDRGHRRMVRQSRRAGRHVDPG